MNPNQTALLALLLPLMACSGSAQREPEVAPAEPEDRPVELRPVLGEKSPRAREEPVTSRKGGQERPVAIVSATLLLGNGKRVENGTILFDKGRIRSVGPKDRVAVPKGAEVINGRGKFVTPGLIDTHSHLGVFSAPHIEATSDGNEISSPITPYVFSEHAFWPQDPGIETAVAGGVTTIQVVTGSTNVIGGRAVTLKLKPALEARAMRFPGAPFGLKMACGENPKWAYGKQKKTAPVSRMGNIYKLRQAFIKAREYDYGLRAYRVEHDQWQKKREQADPGKEPSAPNRDLGLETLVDVLRGQINVHMHCYRADEMLLMIALSKELGFRVTSFHHAVEAYKIADVLAREKISASVWPDWWGFKLESYDGIEENAAIIAAVGGIPIMHSDSNVLIQRLNQAASKALFAGRRAGLSLGEDEAIKWITHNPAEALGILEQTGTLEPNKMADIVLWSANPLSVYAKPERVFIDGELLFERGAPPRSWSDLDVGTAVEEVQP